MLYTKSFPTCFHKFLFTCSAFIIRPYYRCLHNSATLFKPVPPEKDQIFVFVVKHILLTPFYICVQILLFFPVCIAFILRCILLSYRAPYLLSVSKQSTLLQPTKHRDGNFSLTTANVCFLPEALSRYNNIAYTKQRSREIGQRLVVDQYFYQNMVEGTPQPIASSKKFEQQNGCLPPRGRTENDHIVTRFPQTDFMCLQETWDRDYSENFISEVHKVFPWVLYDVGKTSLKSNYFMFNSGLGFASRYPIVDADFKYYTHRCQQSVFTSLGLLMVKIDVSGSDKETKVGYIYTTHMQPYQGERPIIQNQLDEVIKWTDEFRRTTINQSEVVLFDIFCGDFNFDNMSPGEEACWDHRIFSIYEDYGRIRSGKDKWWTVGTDMRQKYIWDKCVSTPEGLKEALQDPVLRQQYVSDADITLPTYANVCKGEPKRNKDGNIVASETGGRRRIDYVLYRKDCEISVRSYRYITRLATLTDHLPICLEFSTKKDLQ